MDEVHITFVHGLANKPPVADLQRIWNEALSMPVDGDDGLDLGSAGVSNSFVYWADLFYERPLPASDYERVGDELTASIEGVAMAPPSGAWVNAMRKHYPDAGSAYPDPPSAGTLAKYERIPLPNFVKKAIMAEYLREAHDYLFNVNGIRDVIRARMMKDLGSCGENTRRVVVGHSQGTFIAYDAMTGLPECPPIDGFMTIGSPLGVDEVQDHLVWTRENGFPSALRGEWVNVFDRFDLISRPDPYLANDFRKSGNEVVVDCAEESWGTWRHSATKYLKGPKLRNHLRRLCNREGA